MAKSRHDKRRERDAKQDKAATVVPAAVNVTQSVTPQVPGSEICSQFALIIEILDAWHPGSGRGRGLQFDATALRDEDGFPYLTGRHLRGLIRDAMVCLAAWKHLQGDATELRLFGPRRGQTGQPQHGRRLDLWRAELPQEDRAALGLAGAAASLFQGRHLIAMDGERQVTQPRTLRSVEIVVPLTLVAPLTLRSSSPGQQASDIKALRQAVALVHAVGRHRNRGLGRARLSLETLP